MFSDPDALESQPSYVRDVALLPGEKVAHVFCPEVGLERSAPTEGQLLVTTNRRILAFRTEDGRNETILVPVEELKGVSVKSSTRSPASLVQGVFLTIGGVFLYVVLAYWLTGRVDGPTIPGLRMDLGPFVVLVSVLMGLGLIVRHYFSRGDGSVTFQGSTWTFAFPFRGEMAGEQVYQVVNTVFAAQHSRSGYSFLWDE